MPVDAKEFRHALGQAAWTVTVVTTTHEGPPIGITVTSFCSLSLDPPLVLVCIDHRARIHDRLPLGGTFAVNFLGQEQQDLSQRFATRGSEPFDDLELLSSSLGTPIFRGVATAIECTTVDLLPGGDHTIVVGRVEATHVHDGPPLLHHRGQYRHLG